MPAIRGEQTDCFALTEPGAGSDARAIVTSAKRDGDDWVINGVKQFISYADVADFIILFAVTGMDDTPKGPRKRFTAFLLDQDTPGVTDRADAVDLHPRLQPQHDLPERCAGAVRARSWARRARASTSPMTGSIPAA